MEIFPHHSISPLQRQVLETILPLLQIRPLNPSIAQGLGPVACAADSGKAAQPWRLEKHQARHQLLQLKETFETRLAAIPGRVVIGQTPNATRVSFARNNSRAAAIRRAAGIERNRWQYI